MFKNFFANSANIFFDIVFRRSSLAFGLEAYNLRVAVSQSTFYYETFNRLGNNETVENGKNSTISDSRFQVAHHRIQLNIFFNLKSSKANYVLTYYHEITYKAL